MNDFAAELVERARALAPGLAERAQRTEELRQLPPETLAEFADAGFYEILVPKSFGGHQLGFATLAAVAREISHGCSSSGWVLGFYGLHNWIMSLLPEQAQAEVFAERPYALAPATFSPGGSATTVDGGYQLSGKWSWASGVMHGNWAMVAGMVSDGGRPDYRLFLLPIEDVQIDDVWFMSGMKGTGSNDIVVTDRFVPAYRTVSFLSILDGTAPGALLHDAPLYRWPLVPMLALGAAAPALGTAESTVERFRLRVTERVMAYSGGAVQRDRPAAQMQLGRSAADVIAARSIYDGAIQQLEQILDHGGSLDAAQRSRYRLIAAHVVFLARKVVSELCAASGGSAHRLDSPFQRAMRDVNTMAGHVVFDYDATTELYGRVQVGLDVPTGTLV